MTIRSPDCRKASKSFRYSATSPPTLERIRISARDGATAMTDATIAKRMRRTQTRGWRCHLCHDNLANPVMCCIVAAGLMPDHVDCQRAVQVDFLCSPPERCLNTSIALGHAAATVKVAARPLQRADVTIASRALRLEARRWHSPLPGRSDDFGTSPQGQL